MRVLAIGNLYPPAALGGYERVFAGTTSALQRAGHEVRVLTTAPVPGAEPRGPDPKGPPVYRELRWYWRDFDWPRLPFRERLALERHNASVLRRHLDWAPDVVGYFAMGGMSLSLIEQVRRARIPAVGVVHDWWMVYGFDVDRWIATWRRHPRLGRLAEPLGGIPTRVDLGAAARWLFNSRAVEEASRRQGHSLPRTGVVHPGVDPARFAERPPAEWRWRLACIGRVEPPKGIGVAIEALSQLPPDATLTVVGEGDANHRAELEALAERLAVGPRVRFASAPPDAVADAYAAADAVLFPVTWSEPWGLVPLEAMSVGRPVIGTGTGGSGEYLRHEENALVVAPGDAPALAAAVRRLAEDPSLRERLRAQGQATARRFTEAAFELAMVRAFEEEAATARFGV